MERRITERDLQEIPQEIWNIIPPCGNYLKTVLKAMLTLSGMLTICEESNVAKDWTFS